MSKTKNNRQDASCDSTAESLLYKSFDLALSSNGYGTDWTINGVDADEDVSLSIGDTDADNWGNYSCPYCGTPLTCSNFRDIDESSEKEWHFDRSYEIRVCRRCAFWEFGGMEGGNKCMDPMTRAYATAVARKFTDRIPQGCAEELAQHLRRHPEFWNQINPTDLEKIIVDIFKANFENCEAIHVGRPGDHGVDVVFIDSNSHKWIVQAKRRERADRAEGFSTLQNILGALAFHGEQRGIIVTTADYFSHQVRQGRKSVEDRGYTIRLIDKGVLNRIIGPMLPRQPWMDFLRQSVFEGLDDMIKQQLVSRLPELNQLELFPDL